MKIMTKKIFREIWLSKFRSISIIAVVAITLAFLAGMRASYPMVLATYELNRKTYNVADGRFTFSQPIDQNNVTSIKNDDALLEQTHIDRIDGRILYHTDLIFKGEKFQAVVIGIDFPNEVNQLVIEQKSPAISDINQILAANDSCLIETHFAGQSVPIIGQDVQLEDTITVDFPGNAVDFVVKGIAQDTDYLYVVDEASLMPLMGELAIVWINLQTVQELRYNGNPWINQILYTVDDRFNKDLILAAADDLSYYFSSKNIDINSLKFEIFDETPDYKMFISDAGAIDSMGTIFGIIGLIVCSIIILNTMSKLVNAQRKNIGLFLAMGARKRAILFHYSGVTLILSAIGVLVGIPLGYSLSFGMSKVALGVYAIHEFAFSLPIIEFIIGAVVTFAICILFTLLSTWSITTVTPREAMTITFTRIKATGKTVSEKAFGWIPLFKPIHMTVPLREVFMKKRKTLITILALVTSMIFLVDSLAMEYNMYRVIMNNFNEYNTYDVQILLETPEPVQKIADFMNDATDPVLANVTHSEIFINMFTKISHEGEFVSWAQIVCYQENSTLRNFNVIKGNAQEKSDLGPQKVLLGNSIAGKYGISLHDQIAIGILGDYSVEVAGLVGELIDYSVLWTYEAYQESPVSPYFGLPKGWVNGIALSVNEGTNLTTLRNSFETNFSINQWTESDAALKSTRALMEAMMGIMMLFLIIGIAIGVLFSFQSMSMAFVDRQRDFLAFKAMGTKMKYIRRMIFWENAILTLFALILTVPFGYLFYLWSMDYMLEDKFYIPMTIPWFTWPLVFILSLFSIWLATGRLTRRIKKMALADELRQTGAT